MGDDAQVMLCDLLGDKVIFSLAFRPQEQHSCRFSGPMSPFSCLAYLRLTFACGVSVSRAVVVTPPPPLSVALLVQVAEEMFEVLLKKDPNDLDTLYNYGRFLWKVSWGFVSPSSILALCISPLERARCSMLLKQPCLLTEQR